MLELIGPRQSRLQPGRNAARVANTFTLRCNQPGAPADTLPGFRQRDASPRHN